MKLKKMLAALLAAASLTTSASTSLSVLATDDYSSDDRLVFTDTYSFLEPSDLDSLKLNIVELPEVTYENIPDTISVNISDAEKNAFGGEAPTRNIWINKITQSELDNVSVTALFKECGTLDGKSISMRVTYTDMVASAPSTDGKCTINLAWTAYGDEQTTSNEWVKLYIESCKVSVTFIDEDENDILLDNAYITSYSLDGYKSSTSETGYSHRECRASDEAVGVYINSSKTVGLEAQHTLNWASTTTTIDNVYYGTYAGVTSAGNKLATTFQFKNTTTLSMDMIIMDGSWTEGYHLYFTPLTAAKPTQTSKSVTATRATAGTSFDYIIAVYMPKSNAANFKLANLSVVDQLDENLTYNSVKVTNAYTGEVQSNAGSAMVKDDNKLTYSFNSSFLNGVDYTQSYPYLLYINVTVNDDVNVAKIPNSATVTYNKGYESETSLITNEVETSIYFTLTVKHIFNGTVLKSSSEEYDYGKSYTTSSETFDNLKLISTPSNANGTITKNTTVIYEYDYKDTSVIVNYVDEDGNKIADSDTIAGKINDSYSTSAKTIKNYTLKTTPSNASGTMVETTTIVTYVYSHTPVGTLQFTKGIKDEDGTITTDTSALTSSVRSKLKFQIADGSNKNYLIYAVKNSDGTYTYTKDSTVSGATNVFTLNSNNQIIVYDLPANAKYTVVETQTDTDTFTSLMTEVAGTITEDATTIITGYNQLKPEVGSFTITKNLTKSYYTDEEFVYQITQTDKSGNSTKFLAYISIPAGKTSGSVTIDGAYSTYTYTVKEMDNNWRYSAVNDSTYLNVNNTKVTALSNTTLKSYISYSKNNSQNSMTFKLKYPKTNSFNCVFTNEGHDYWLDDGATVTNIMKAIS